MIDWTPERCYETSGCTQSGYGPWPPLPPANPFEASNPTPVWIVPVRPPVPRDIGEWLRRPREEMMREKRHRRVFQRFELRRDRWVWLEAPQ